MTGRAESLLKRADKAFLIAHTDPDGDTVGSTLALAYALRKMGKECTLACSDPVPDLLFFLPGVEEFGAPQVTDHDLIVTVDASDPGRLGQTYKDVLGMDLPILNIDHHITNTGFGTVNLVRSDAAATAEIIFDLLTAWKVEVDQLLATYLLTGIVTDTRSFSTSNTTPRALEVSSELVASGASLIDINERYYRSKGVETLRLWGQMLNRMQLDGHLVWSVNTLEMREDCRADSDDGDGIVNLLASVREAVAAIVFKENEGDQIEVSIRSRPGVDISSVAVHFGGGGHPQAAGAVVNGTLEQVVPSVLSKAREVVATGA
ncbi:MAG TPA: bifunctional oligoribonuclease/PAP phosphatase NrnA [Anaerolineae bacterium]|nr:bifunctional oligoribonuclease/PAP phosphatase NrnA [Anaerolineae bacterium]